jgi:hypothetical protein
MRIIVASIILFLVSFGSCKPKKTVVAKSAGINTSRSNIKNNIEEKDSTTLEKNKTEKK